jgi:hypothetical protein
MGNGTNWRGKCRGMLGNSPQDWIGHNENISADFDGFHWDGCLNGALA